MKQRALILIDGDILEGVYEYRYGDTLPRQSEDIDKRITVMRQIFGQYGKFTKYKKIPTFFNRKITDTGMTY